MNPQGELLKEVTTAISLYKEGIEKLEASGLNHEVVDKVLQEMLEARKHLFSFLETPQYED